MKLVFALPLLAFLMVSTARASDEFLSLCYHDVRDAASPNKFTIRTQNLIEQFEYLKSAGYTTVGIDDLQKAHSGRKPLPKNAILLTFDDGLSSFYTTVFPLLKQYRYKAVFAVVGKWVDEGKVPHDYAPGDEVETTVNWKQLKEMSDSGLVDVVPHTYDLHQGVVFNPQGNEGPAASFFEYSPATGKYEEDDQLRKRVRADLRQNSKQIREKIGKQANVIVWPYGSFNQIGMDEAAKAGMKINLALEDGGNTVKDLTIIRRGLVMAETTLDMFKAGLERKLTRQVPTRSLRIDLNQIYDPDPVKRDEKLGQLLERIRLMTFNTVYIEALTDTNGNGLMDAAYFPNDVLPVKAELFSRVAHQIGTRTQARMVYASIPSHVIELSGSEAHKTKVIARMLGQLAKTSNIVGVVFEEAPGEGEEQLTKYKESVRKYRPVARFYRFLREPTVDHIAKASKHYDGLVVSASAELAKQLTPDDRTKTVFEFQDTVKDLGKKMQDLTLAGASAVGIWSANGDIHPEFSVNSEPLLRDPRKGAKQ